MTTKHITTCAVSLALGLLIVISPSPAVAHCDTMDGPVVMDAQKALELGDVTPVLKWVRADQENDVQSAFDGALATKDEDDAIRQQTEFAFFETLVRLHRESEGESFTGLLPAGTAWDPVVRAADRSLDRGDAEHIVHHALQAAEHGIRKRFERVMRAREHVNDSVEAGREYVEAYVDYVHYVKHLIATAESDAAQSHDDH